MPFGHIFKAVNGYLETGDGTQRSIYTCLNPFAYSNAVTEDYTLKCTHTMSSGYAKALVRDTYGSVVVTDSSGGYNTYLYDYR